MYDDFTDTLAAIGEKIIAKDVAPAKEEESKEEKVGQPLPFWPDDVAAMPTELTRASIFGLVSDKPGARRLLDDERIECRADIEVLFTGKTLSVKDETVWLACLRLGRNVPMGQRVFTSKSALTKACGLTRGGPNWATTLDSLTRLSKAHFEIRVARKGKSIRLTTGLLKWGYAEDTGNLYFRLDPDGAKLFECLAFQSWDVRLSLKSDFAARLLSYISGHKHGRVHTVLLDELRRWCGYNGRLDKFEKRCHAALIELESAGVLVAGKSAVVKTIRGKKISWVRTIAPRKGGGA